MGVHLYPFRTQQLSPLAPMVLHPWGVGRVGRRQDNAVFLISEIRRAGGSGQDNAVFLISEIRRAGMSAIALAKEGGSGQDNAVFFLFY